MRFLDPTTYGVWLALNILLAYSAYAHLGLEYGMGVRLPYYRGKEDAERERAIETTVYTAWTALALIMAFAVAMYALWRTTGLVRWGLVAIAAMIPLEQQSQFFVRWHTSSRIDFEQMTWLSLARSVALLVLVVPAAALFGIYGVIGGTLIVSALIAAAWHSRATFPIRLVISGDALRELLRVGFPIALVVGAGMLIESADRMLILAVLGTVSLGYYGVTGLGGSSVYSFLSQAGSAMSPHMAQEMGRSGDAPEVLEKYLVKPTLFFASSAAFLTLSLWFIIPPVVTRFLPQYQLGIPAFYAYVPGFFFLAIVITANNIVNLVLIARQRQRWLLLLQAIAVLCEVGFGYLFICLGWGIAGVAVASTLAYAVYGATVLVMASAFVLNRRVARRFIIDVMTPIVYCGAVGGAILWFAHRAHAHMVAAAAVQLFVYVAACVPLLPWLNGRAPFVGEALQALRSRGLLHAARRGA